MFIEEKRRNDRIEEKVIMDSFPDLDAFLEPAAQTP